MSTYAWMRIRTRAYVAPPCGICGGIQALCRVTYCSPRILELGGCAVTRNPSRATSPWMNTSATSPRVWIEEAHGEPAECHRRRERRAATRATHALCG